MVMKMFNKGQVVIPAAIREDLGIAPGDLLDVTVDAQRRCVRLTPHAGSRTRTMAGSLSKYASRKSFPTRRQAHDALQQGLAR
jgi:AbrB family looped-hinge helix DNA binding protein